MKVFFDTNVYVSEALLGEGAETMLSATEKASWRIFVSDYVLDEIDFGKRFPNDLLTQKDPLNRWGIRSTEARKAEFGRRFRRKSRELLLRWCTSILRRTRSWRSGRRI